MPPATGAPGSSIPGVAQVKKMGKKVSCVLLKKKKSQTKAPIRTSPTVSESAIVGVFATKKTPVSMVKFSRRNLLFCAGSVL